MSQPDTLNRIKSEIEGNKIVVFMKGTPDSPMCGFSSAVVQLLKSHKYPFKGVDVLANPDIRETLPDYSDWPTFPQVFIDGKLVGGCDILHELEESGELKKMLESTFKK